MKILYKLTIIWVIVLSITFFASSIYFYFGYKTIIFNSDQTVKKHIGEKLEFEKLLDTTQNQSLIHFDTEFAIVNFWFAGCQPCLDAMKKFQSSLNENQYNYTHISISIDPPSTWINLIGATTQFHFLSKSVKNWNHYVINKEFSTQYLQEKYGIMKYPTYIVINRNHEIVDVPYNLSFFINTKIKNQSLNFNIIKYCYFDKDSLVVKSTAAILALISTIYVVISLFILGISRLIRKYKS